ncbi:hypothetical protein DPMN_036157 [Dreissena polymorpha]|uniref:Uncharacterized protein n=1 Tax=Dreissena polymorpha TaxID=45954 RepID=A0A9D4MC18_DREPO|nr:hypothetical protein DPMN_036157 [Dreissena polymorpha]
MFDKDFEKSGQTQLGIDGCRCGNAAYLIVVIEVIGVFKASTFLQSNITCGHGFGRSAATPDSINLTSIDSFFGSE